MALHEYIANLIFQQHFFTMHAFLMGGFGTHMSNKPVIVHYCPIVLHNVKHKEEPMLTLEPIFQYLEQ